MESIIKEENLSYHPFFKFEKIGDAIEGIYREKRVQFSEMAGKNQTHYLIETDTGDCFWVAGRGQKEPQIIAGMEESEFGDTVALKYAEDIPSKTPGYHAAKRIDHYRVALDRNAETQTEKALPETSKTEQIVF